MTYSVDFRRKVLDVRDAESLSMAQVAKRFHIGLATVMRWTKKPEPQRRRNKPATKINMEALKQDIETYPDAYAYERAHRLGVSKTGVWHAMKRLNVTYKKKPHAPSFHPRRTACLSSSDSNLR